MFADFLNRLFQPEPQRLSGAESHLALAALLVRVARADGHYDAAEAERILAVLRDRYDLDDAAALALRGQAEHLEAEAPDTVRFTRALKEAVPYQDHSEDTFLRVVSNLLGVSDVDSALARQRVAAATG
jgi:uncharacterized tellurite resistance protein B-like protein